MQSTGQGAAELQLTNASTHSRARLLKWPDSWAHLSRFPSSEKGGAGQCRQVPLHTRWKYGESAIVSQ